MKVFAIFCILFVYSQATSQPTSVQHRVESAVRECIKERDGDEKEIRQILDNGILPEFDSDFANFITCYWRKLGLLNDAGIVNHLQLKVMIPHIIRTKYSEIANVEEVATNAVNQCKDTTGGSIGQKVIKYRNCMTQYVQNQHK